MEMGVRNEVGRIDPRGEVYQCPSCQYSDGFHVSFRWKDSGEEAEVYLICPSCHSRSRIGWMVSLPSSPQEASQAPGQKKLK